MDDARTVWPGRGSAGTEKRRSAFTLPTTQTRAAAMGVTLDQRWTVVTLTRVGAPATFDTLD